MTHVTNIILALAYSGLLLLFLALFFVFAMVVTQ